MTPSAPFGPQEAAESSIREFVNVCLDAVVSTFQRLLELPLVGVLVGGVLLALACLWFARRATRRGAGKRAAAWRWLGVLLGLGVLLFALDRKLRREHERIEELREQARASTMALLERQLPRAPLVDVPAAAAALQATFAGLELRRAPLDEATDLVRFRCTTPLARGALAIVDLTDPHVGIVMDADFATKTMTSAFGRAFRCTVAINGEAGNSPQPDCGLGRWKGFLRIAGRDLLAEDAGNPRPYLAFDGAHRARYVGMQAADRALRPAEPDAIWGRVDAIVGGTVVAEDYRFDQPRAVMGVDRDGKRLYLLAVDGRQPGRSLGFTRVQVGEFLRAFGVHDAMLCDEGGSACLYADAFGGLVTTPSDNQGEERPTYTHFGIVRRP